MRIDNEPIVPSLVDPINLRKSWLPKVHSDGVKKLQDIIRHGHFYCAIGIDETADARVSNDFMLTVELVLIPKVATPDDDTAVRRFHLSLEFPSEVNNQTIALALDKVRPYNRSVSHSTLPTGIEELLHTTGGRSFFCS